MTAGFTSQQLFQKFKALGWTNNVQSVSIFKFLINVKKQTKDKILLDLGAGECRYEFFFNRSYYITVDFAKGDSSWDWSKLDIIGDISNLNFIKDETVDHCLCTTTLEHVQEPHKFFKEISRVLKPGGRLFLYVPYLIDEHQIPHDFFRYTSFGLKYLVRQAGLKLVLLKPSSGPLSTGVHLVNHALSIAVAKDILTRLTIILFRLSFKYLLTPLFLKLDKNVEIKRFPKDWILIAQKELSSYRFKKALIKFRSKEEAINTVLRCPKCKRSLKPKFERYVCPNCSNQYPRINNQVNFLN